MKTIHQKDWAARQCRRVNLARAAGEVEGGGIAHVRLLAHANRLDLGRVAEVIAATTAAEAARQAADALAFRQSVKTLQARFAA